MNWSAMKTIYYESGLLWTDLLWTRSVMYWTVINVACYESALLWTWSVMNVVCMNVICYERGLLWTWSVTNVACLWIGSDVPESFLSSQSQVRVTIPSSQSRVIWNFVESESSHDFVKSSQSRVTRMVESLRVIGLQARVNVEPYKFQTFPIYFCL